MISSLLFNLKWIINLSTGALRLALAKSICIIVCHVVVSFELIGLICARFTQW